MAILDDRKSLLIAFLAISDQYVTFCFHIMAAGGHFGSPKITSINQSIYFNLHHYIQCISIAFLAISYQYATFFFEFCFQNGRRAILDDRKSLSIAFLAISDQYTTSSFFFFFFKMAAGGNFGSPICAKNNGVLPLCVINGYAKYEVDR